MTSALSPLRAQEGGSIAARILSTVEEIIVTRLIRSRCKIRSCRSSSDTPQIFVSASGASAEITTCMGV